MNALTLDRTSTSMLAQGLGWFSLGLGAAEVFAPQAVARFLGMRDGVRLIQSYGVREMGAGIGLLTAQNAKPWMISRVGGDAIDIATLLAGFRKKNPKNVNVAFALAAVLGVTVADVICTLSLNKHQQQLLARQKQAARDYSRRSGFSKPAHEMRGAARDFAVPEDFRTPKALRPLNG